MVQKPLYHQCLPHSLQMACFLERKMKPQGTAIAYHQCGINVKIMNTHKGNKVEVELIFFNSGPGQQPLLSNIASSL